MRACGHYIDKHATAILIMRLANEVKTSRYSVLKVTAYQLLMT